MCEDELIDKLKSLAGFTIKEILFNKNISLLTSSKFDKGSIGKLIECLLGLINNNYAKQDFFDIGLELKTIPVNNFGFPIEDTFVCSAKLIGNFDYSWESSYVKSKISRVLWIPVEHYRRMSILDKRIGLPIIWSPNCAEEKLLKIDWEEIMSFIILGEIEKLDSIYGDILYIKSKAKNSNYLTNAIGNDGEIIMVNPKSFYLRKFFTKKILFHNFNYKI
ncbi:DNA mismatch repair endonuclease MutH [Candidatus Purcelliella pentastirinorum]|uniref:DNA mismatch repair endonuclease MutH n=1 Tax=Candidatus Purcelliella pentastirinorum TaxID=472834 RepID=A0AAX3N8Q8_9ENTR|nr:DNA mismatch repair endonuclease MutH [Candidatus Purcelliella pentastirinorum]WDI78487.1 DNA mismatch repair endonuclease MutH [Candidatus Purcelliella pentastirinorum]